MELHIDSRSLGTTTFHSQLNASTCLIEAVDESLEILGKQISPLVYGYMQRSFQITKDEIPARPGALLTTLSRLFGAASKSLEESIVRRFYAKMGLRPGVSANMSFHSMYARLQRGSALESTPKVRWM